MSKAQTVTQALSSEDRAYERMADAVSWALTYRNSDNPDMKMASEFAVRRAWSLIDMDFGATLLEIIVWRVASAKGLPRLPYQSADELLAKIGAY